MSAHVWRVSPQWVSEEPADVEADCYRLLRGPYTGTGVVLRALVPEIWAQDPELARPHLTEILAIAPDLEKVTGPGPDTLTTLAQGEERTRIYAVGRTRQLAHGIVDLLREYAACRSAGHLTLAFRNLDEADHTDQELLAILLRRSGQRIKVIAGTRVGRVADDDLQSALHRHACRVDQPALQARPDGRTPEELLRCYIGSDGTSDDSAEIAAYQQADPAHRAALHDARAAELRGQDEWGTQLGAIPYHLAHGNDPGGAGLTARLAALDYVFTAGFYHTTMEGGLLGLQIADPDTHLDQWWHLNGRTANSLALLGRAEEAEPLYLAVRGRLTLPRAQMVNSYALAMVYTRYHAPDRKNHSIAKTYMNTAIAIAAQWPDPAQRAFYTVFNNNALALVEMHAGNLDEALRLVMEGRESLNRELGPSTHQLHRSVLVANAASLLARLGRLEESLADYDEVIQADPNYADYHFERADVRRRLGDITGAFTDYAAAEALAPPLWELHYNRANMAAEIGDLGRAITDLSRAIELEPTQLDARVNLASLLAETGDLAGACAVANAGLLLHPGDPSLLCVRAQVAAGRGDASWALADLEMSLAADSEQISALAIRAGIAYDAQDYRAAINDLTRAIEVAGGDPDLLYNRGRALQAARRFGDAARDFTQALELDGADTEELLLQREICLGERQGSCSQPPGPMAARPGATAGSASIR